MLPSGNRNRLYFWTFKCGSWWQISRIRIGTKQAWFSSEWTRSPDITMPLIRWKQTWVHGFNSLLNTYSSFVSRNISFDVWWNWLVCECKVWNFLTWNQTWNLLIFSITIHFIQTTDLINRLLLMQMCVVRVYCELNKQYFKSCDSDSNISCDRKWKSQWPLLEDCMMYLFTLQLVKLSWLLCLIHCSSMQ